MKKGIVWILIIAAVGAAIWLLANIFYFKDVVDVRGFYQADEAFFTEVEKDFPKGLLEKGFRGVYQDEDGNYYAVTSVYATLYRFRIGKEPDTINIFGGDCFGYFVEEDKLYFIDGSRTKKTKKWTKLWGLEEDSFLEDLRYFRYGFPDHPDHRCIEIDEETYMEAYQKHQEK